MSQNRMIKRALARQSQQSQQSQQSLQPQMLKRQTNQKSNRLPVGRPCFKPTTISKRKAAISKRKAAISKNICSCGASYVRIKCFGDKWMTLCSNSKVSPKFCQIRHNHP